MVGVHREIASAVELRASSAARFETVSRCTILATSRRLFRIGPGLPKASYSMVICSLTAGLGLAV
jgi:hypothetical protein